MAARKDNAGGVVYSTEHGKMCPDCSSPVVECLCNQKKSTFPRNGIVRVEKETKGRKGKVMTVITGVPLDRQELLKLGKQLKKKCGSGGTVKDGVIEIQGDHRDMLVEELEKPGWTVKRTGK